MLLNESLMNEGFFFPPIQGQADYYTVFVRETINFCQIYKNNGLFSTNAAILNSAYLRPVCCLVLPEPAERQ